MYWLRGGGRKNEKRGEPVVVPVGPPKSQGSERCDEKVPEDLREKVGHRGKSSRPSPTLKKKK